MVEIINKKSEKCSLCKKEFDFLVLHGYELYCIDDYTREILNFDENKYIKKQKVKKIIDRMAKENYYLNKAQAEELKKEFGIG